MSLTIRKGNITLGNPPIVASIKALAPRKRAAPVKIATIIGIALALLRLIVNTPNVRYIATLIIPTKIIIKKNTRPATIPIAILAIASPKFDASRSIEKLKTRAKGSISRNSMAKMVTVFISSNTPTIILKVLIKFIFNFHFHLRFRENKFDIDNYL